MALLPITMFLLALAVLAMVANELGVDSREGFEDPNRTATNLR
jgi:hypothetical protein